MRACLPAALLFLSLPAFAQSKASLKGVDVYRSAHLSSAEAKKRWGERLNHYVMLRNGRRAPLDEKAEEIRVQIEKDLRAIPGVAWAKLSITEYFTSRDHGMYAIFDVVDAAELSRMAFKPVPKASLRDPSGLLALWRRYVSLGETLSRRGEMPIERPSCPGFYCLWGGKPELDAMQQEFSAGVKKEGEALRRILDSDADGEKRAAALFVLSYGPVGVDVVGAANESLSDSDNRVRGAALQILADIANHNPDLPIALESILLRLDDPVASERGKAMGLLVPLAERDKYRHRMLAAAPRLAALLKLEHPESRDLAFTLLSLLSKKDFSKRDHATWARWAASATAGQP